MILGLMDEKLSCKPIGYFQSPCVEKYMLGRQAGLASNSEGSILLSPGCNFEQGLEDLVGFERIWVVFWMHRALNWKPKVLPPRGGVKRGVFATRSPHRPNPLGLSCVELKGINGRELWIGRSDLLDGTPILDIKPYLSYADAFPESRQGWISDLGGEEYSVEWSEEAIKQATYIEQHAGIRLVDTVELRLREQPRPFGSFRIKEVGENRFVLAIKTWRVNYQLVGLKVIIQDIVSGYDEATVRGEKDSRWDDVGVHRAFLTVFKQ